MAQNWGRSAFVKTSSALRYACTAWSSRPAALSPLARSPSCHDRISEVVLGSRPALRQIGFGIDLQYVPVGLNCLAQQRGGFVSAGANPLIPERIPQNVLRIGPVLGQIGLGEDLERAAKRLRRLIEQADRLVSAGPLSLSSSSTSPRPICVSGPGLRLAGLGVDLQRAAIRLRRLIEKAYRFVSAGPLSLVI